MFVVVHTNDTSKIFTEDAYHLLVERCNWLGLSKMVQPEPSEESHGSKIRIAMRPSRARGVLGTGRFPPRFTCFYWIMYYNKAMAFLTILPLLRRAPVAQKESDTTFKGVAVLVSKFHRAAQVVCPLIIRGSFVALSINIARVGDTTIVSNATTPDVPF
jgi:hypothetical protein